MFCQFEYFQIQTSIGNNEWDSFSITTTKFRHPSWFLVAPNYVDAASPIRIVIRSGCNGKCSSTKHRWHRWTWNTKQYSNLTKWYNVVMASEVFLRFSTIWTIRKGWRIADWVIDQIVGISWILFVIDDAWYLVIPTFTILCL